MKLHQNIIIAAIFLILFLFGWTTSARAYVIIGGTPPATGPAPGEQNTIYSAGIYTFSSPDFILAGPLGIALNRVYRSNDETSAGTWNVRSFGVGCGLNYDMFLYSNSEASGQGYTDAELVLPNGGQVVCPRTSSCTQNGCSDYTDAVFQCTGEPYNEDYGATITYDSALPGWDMTLKDHSVYKFGLGAPMQSVLDRNGNTMTLVRSGGQSGNITHISDSNGRYVNLYYNISGHPNLISEGVDSSGRTIFYKYDSSQRLTSVTVGSSSNAQEKYTYVNGTSQLGNIATNQVLATGTTYSSTSIAYTSDSNHFLSTITLPTGINTIWSYTYGLTGSRINNITITDPLGYQNPGHHQRFIQFNSSGYVTSDTQAYGESIAETLTYGRGSNGFISTVTDQLGRETCYSYDSLQNPTSITKLCGGWNGENPSTASYTYGSCSQVASVTDPDNVAISGTFDSNCNLLTESGTLNGTLTFAYNPAGELTSITDGNQNTTTINYNNSTLDISSIVDPLQNTFTLTEDGHGNLATFSDPFSHSTTYTFTGVGSSWTGGLFPDKLSQITDANNSTTSYTYDFIGNPTKVTDANGHSSSYGYSGLLNAIGVTDANGNTTTLFDDNLGNISSVVERNGNSISFTRDDLNRATTVTYAGTKSSNSVSYTYDLGNRMLTAVDTAGGSPSVPGNTVTRTYDGMDNILTEAKPEGTVTYTYDLASLRKTMTAGSQATVTYSYDSVERLSSESNGTVSTTFSYDAGGRRSCLTLPNNVIVGYGYNAGSHVTSITYGTGGSCSNPPSNIGNLSYSYDADSRRISMGGSLAAVNLPSTVSSATYGKANQLTKWNGVSSNNDKNNNLTTNPANSDNYTWNFRNELATTSSGYTYYYDAFDRRETVVQGSTTTSYLYDHVFPIHTSNSSSGNTDFLASPGATEEYAITTSAGTLVPIHDAIGSTIGLVNSQGAVSQISYSPFGQTSSSSGQYTGQQLDSAAALIPFPFRYYSPVLQRFLSEDPIGLTGDSTNLFQYALNSPTNLVDPAGLQVWPGDPGWYGVGLGNDPTGTAALEGQYGAALLPNGASESGGITAALFGLTAYVSGGAVALWTPVGYIVGYVGYKVFGHPVPQASPPPTVNPNGGGPAGVGAVGGGGLIGGGTFGEGPYASVGSQSAADNSLAGAFTADAEMEAEFAAEQAAQQAQQSGGSGSGGGGDGGGSGGGGGGGAGK